MNNVEAKVSGEAPHDNHRKRQQEPSQEQDKPKRRRASVTYHTTWYAWYRHQVQLHVLPPLQTDVAARRRLNSAVGFNDVLAAVQPLPDSLPDLPRRVGELEAQLRSAEADAAAPKRSVVPQMLARGNAEQLLKISSSKVESLEAENRRLRATNNRVDVLLQKMKESTSLHTQDLELAQAETFRSGTQKQSSLTVALRSPSPARSPRGRPRSRSQSVSRKRATSAPSPPSAVQTSPAATKAIKDDRPPELVDLTSDVELSSSPEDSPQVVPSAEKDSRDPVPPPTGDKTVPEAPVPAAEASSVTKKIPDSGQSDENEGTTFHDLVALSGSDDEDEDPPRSAQASSSSTARRPSDVTSPYRSSSDESSSSDDEGPRDPSIAKRPSLPSLPPSTPIEVDDDGGRSRKDAGGDIPSLDFPSGDTAGEEAVPAPTEGSSPAGGAGAASAPARSGVPGGKGSPADSGRPSADEGRLAVPRPPTPPEERYRHQRLLNAGCRLQGQLVAAYHLSRKRQGPVA
ncbi:hypothetical protein PC123_g9294 [Phytophthora cactorum]|nr:hypothetical protein PC123_g9294 [Phytophthora cactorum]